MRADSSDQREWLRGAPICPFLRAHHIAHVGRMWADPAFEVIRSEASGTFALVGLEGEGETLVDGSWRRVRPNGICLLPAFAHSGIRARGRRWHFAWVRYEESRDTAPVLSANSPVFLSGNGMVLSHAVAGLAAEFADGAEPASVSLYHWVELIHQFVRRVAEPYAADDRLWKVWEMVAEDLTRDWRLADLARIASLGPEQLRRLVHRQLGRSPMQQVTHLRMRRAVELLTTTTDKVETIAYEVGFASPFTFSNAFKRWTGKRPSDFRAA